MLSKVAQGEDIWPFKNIMGGAFIRDGEFKNRFSFVMDGWWGDLRTRIDEQMLVLLSKNSHGPPFSSIKDVLFLIWEASNDLRRMHAAGVVHRDVQASNVLIKGPSTKDYDRPIVIDYECSVGVIGTGFWRAPEILEQVQKRDYKTELVFTEKADIYSFGMMCYEIITGCCPFEGHPQKDYSNVQRGERPRLPYDLNPKLKELVLDCWQPDPQLRPTSVEINNRLKRLGLDLGLDLSDFF